MALAIKHLLLLDFSELETYKKLFTSYTDISIRLTSFLGNSKLRENILKHFL
jgi:hypothetical protein